MMRYMSAIAGMTLAASLLGCGPAGGGNTGGGDMAMKPVPVPDMVMVVPADMTMLAGTGAPCMADSECAAGKVVSQKGKCIKTSTFGGKTVTWTGGYCKSACRAASTDTMGAMPTYTNSDCPSDQAVCNGGSSMCEQICNAIADCRDGYVCSFSAGYPVGNCIPLGASICDPPMDPRPAMKTCPMGQSCVSFSPDGSYGNCADTCDPVIQNCIQPMAGMNGCIVDNMGANGLGECINAGMGAEGSDCHFLNDCAAGMQCFGGKCRQYCRTGTPDGGIPDGGMNYAACPAKETCKDITYANTMIKFKADKTGICAP